MLEWVSNLILKLSISVTLFALSDHIKGLGRPVAILIFSLNEYSKAIICSKRETISSVIHDF